MIRPTLCCALALGLALVLPASAQSESTASSRALKPALPEAKVAARVDALCAEAWSQAKLKPAGISSDAAFLRRVSLDLLGRLPTPQRVQSFLKDTRPDKRTRLIAALSEHPDYVKNWAAVWETWLIRNRVQRKLALGGKARFYRGVLRSWLEQKLAKNTRYDVIVRELLTAEGATDENGAVVFLLRWENPGNMAIVSTKLFLGVCMNCILFHDHKQWTKEDFWAQVAFFGRTRQRVVRGVGIQALELFEGRRGEFRVPGSRKLVAPRYLGRELPLTRTTKRRELFAKLVTTDHRYFARALVNRVWAHFFGGGFVTPLDALANVEARLPRVLALLAQDFADHGYDLRRLNRILAQTKVYQRSSRIRGKRDLRLFSQGAVRPLSPEQLFHSLYDAIGVGQIVKARERAQEARGSMGRAARQRRKRRGRRPIDKALDRFLRLFDNEEVLEEGLEYERTVLQALLMINGQATNALTRSPQGTVARVLREAKGDAARLRQLYLRTLCREPRPAEAKRLLAYVRSRPKADEAWHDVFWALLNSTEFFYNH